MKTIDTKTTRSSVTFHWKRSDYNFWKQYTSLLAFSMSEIFKCIRKFGEFLQNVSIFLGMKSTLQLSPSLQSTWSMKLTSYRQDNCYALSKLNSWVCQNVALGYVALGSVKHCEVLHRFNGQIASFISIHLVNHLLRKVSLQSINFFKGSSISDKKYLK